MEFKSLVQIVKNEPLFETSLLLAGAVDPNNTRRQLSRWVNAGRLYQLRRGLYTLAPPFQKVKPHPFLVANRMVRGSYVSLHAALAYFGLIPEAVPVVTSVTTGRPGGWQTPLGDYSFRRVKTALFFGYTLMDVGSDQTAYVATPEKALLDLIYLQPDGETSDYLQGLRLQNLDRLDGERLVGMAEKSGSAKLRRAVLRVAELVRAESEEYEDL